MSTNGAWNPWSTLSESKGEKRSANYLFRATRDNVNKLGSGRSEFIRDMDAKQKETYNPYTDSGGHITGYHQKDADPFKMDFGGVAAAHDTKLADFDPLSSAMTQSVTVDSATGVTTLNTAIYGEAPMPELGMSFSQMALGLADSVMDQFTTIQDSNSYNPSGYAANGFGNTKGIFGNFNGGASERRDMWGRAILTEGIQDYVEEGGRRWNLDIAGNMTEVNPLTGQALDAGTVNGYYQTAGWDANQSTWSGSTMDSFYGTTSTNTASGSVGSYYQTSGWDANTGSWNTASMDSLYGTATTASNNTTAADIYGSSSSSSSWNIFGPTATDNSGSSSGWYGSTQTADTSNYFGNNGTNTQSSSGNIYASHGHHHASRTDDDTRANWFFT